MNRTQYIDTKRVRNQIIDSISLRLESMYPDNIIRVDTSAVEMEQLEPAGVRLKMTFSVILNPKKKVEHPE